MKILMTRLEGNMKMSIVSFEDNCINIIKTKWTSFTPNLDIALIIVSKQLELIKVKI